ncbi:hypothetical protein ETSB_0326 [cyanobacterium endosymbiont of Epithemia turgida isolate EtSB Lake Yunoko]|nr:hypothetical protein ETSB_0326 [cyanobacterium endosymbiont of Epithemia turgida isolate EtSB Lake Yunoko]
MPFELSCQQYISWLYHGSELEGMHIFYADFNVINFPTSNMGQKWEIV